MQCSIIDRGCRQAATNQNQCASLLRLLHTPQCVSHPAHHRRNEAVNDINSRDASSIAELEEETAVLRQEQQQYQGVMSANTQSVRDVSERERVRLGTWEHDACRAPSGVYNLLREQWSRQTVLHRCRACCMSQQVYKWGHEHRQQHL